MRLEDVASTYESATGHTPRDLEFYTLYAALRHAIVMSRVAQRSVLFGELEMPSDPDDMIMHRATLEKMLDGTYWSDL
jgi:aminoglycoside phosphotransferase (APT) family kinase protein